MDTFFRIKVLRTVISSRIFIVKAVDRIEAEEKALQTANGFDYAQRMPTYKAETCSPIEKNAIEAGATIIE